jgi:two-component system, NtrC family, response regulator AtoC
VSRNKVLVVESHASARNALAELLRDDGYEVETAATGADALLVLDAFGPHVVLTDVQLPGLDRPDAPCVIAMTPFGAHAVAVEALRAGARAYLPQPIHFDELLVVLAKVVELAALEREVTQLRMATRETPLPKTRISCG